MDKKDGNILIAMFMGAKDMGDGWLSIPNRGWGYQKKWLHSSLKYSSSWDWLMPCVEKIGNMYGERKIENYRNFVLFDLTIISNIETVWQAVIQFIQWYNTQPH